MKKMGCLILAVLMLLSLLTVGAAAEEPQSGSYYRIALRRGNAGFFTNMSRTDGTQIFLSPSWTCVDDELWLLLDAGDGTFELINKHSRKNLDVPGSSLDKNKTLVQNTYSGANSQRWVAEAAEGGGYYLKNFNSGLYLTAQNSMMAQCEKQADLTDRQVFLLNYLTDGAEAAPKNYVIRIAGTTQVLAPSADKNGAHLAAAEYDAADETQVWFMRDVGDSVFKVVNQRYKLGMDVSGNNNNPGSAFLIYTANNGSNQRFQFLDQGDGTCVIIPQHSLLYCTLRADGTVVQDELGAEGTQRFILEELQ